MKDARDKIIKTDPTFSEFSTWSALDVDDGHEVLKKAAQACISTNTALGARFTELRMTEKTSQRKEKTWLMTLLDVWYFKKWNQKKNLDIHKASSPSKKRPLQLDCSHCGTMLVCSNPDCSGEIHKVFS